MKISEKIKQIQITTSLRCNLNCPYCFQKVVDSTYVNRDGKCSYKQIESLSKIVKSGDKIKFTILGGEPFLELEFIDALLEWCSKNNIEYRLLFLTNGLLLSSETVLSKIKEYQTSALSLGIIVSFDNKFKSPFNFGSERFEILSQFPNSSTYVVDGKEAIDSIETDIGLLNEFNMIPKVLYDYERMYELKDENIASRLVNALKKVKIQNTSFYNTDIEKCGFVYIDENGDIGPCYNTFYKEIDITQIPIQLEKCKKCDIQHQCSHCGPRRVLYGDDWCAYSRCIQKTIQ